VETDQARGKNIALHLKYYFESKKDTPQKVLFMGHRGSGKSTELFRLEQFLGHAFKLVRFSIKEVDIIDFNYIDLIFLLLDKLYEQALSDHIQLHDKLLANLNQFWNDKKIIQILNISKAEMNAEVKMSGGFWNFIRLKVKAIFRTGVEIKEEIRRTCTPKISQLIQQTNDLIDNIRNEYVKKDQTLLVVIEDLDKLDIHIAEDLFLKRSNILGQFNTHIIYTFPIFLHYSEFFNTISESFDHYELLSMIKITNKDNTPNIDGRQILNQIIEKRVLTQLFEDRAIDALISYSGGVLRHLFRMMSNAVLSSLVAQSERVTVAAVKTAFDDIKSGFERSIEPKYMTTLTQLYKDNDKTPLPDSDLRALLNCMAVIEYNGQRWCGLHPAVIRMLEERGLTCISK
jgi:energy-coupling factor transporter ATP-binding protein EcfA2